MAAVDLGSLSKEQHDELACTYAALILHDNETEITSDKISTLLKASKNEVESYWPMLFSNALKGQDVGQLLFSLSGASAGPAVSAGAETAAVEEEKPAEVAAEEESDDELMGGMDLFG